MDLSVVIPTYNRPGLLAQGLAALSHQGLARGRFEVIVVDDGSAEPLDAAVAPASRVLDLRLLRKPNGGLAAARNHGAAAARGEVLLFLDDDIRPCPEFLEAHLSAHAEDQSIVALGSLPHPADLALTPFLHYLERVVHYDLFRRYGSAEQIPLPPLNGNSSLRRRHFERAGGYDLAFSSYGGEDTEMGYRLLCAGLRFVYLPGARGYHYHSKDFAAYKRDMYSSGVTMVAIVRRYPEVVSRVNMDLVVGRLGTLPWGKRAKRLLFLLLERWPALVRLLDRLVGIGERLGQRRALYPLYLLVSHYHYGLGMRAEIARAGLVPSGSARRGEPAEDEGPGRS